MSQIDFDLEEFLLNAVLSIQRYCEWENDVQGALLQSQVLVRDVVLVHVEQCAASHSTHMLKKTTPFNRVDPRADRCMYCDR